MATQIFFNFQPENWGRWTHFDSYFSNGLKPPTRLTCPLRKLRLEDKPFLLTWHLSSGDVLVFEGVFFCSSGEYVFFLQIEGRWKTHDSYAEEFLSKRLPHGIQFQFWTRMDKKKYKYIYIYTYWLIRCMSRLSLNGRRPCYGLTTFQVLSNCLTWITWPTWTWTGPSFVDKSEDKHGQLTWQLR